MKIHKCYPQSQLMKIIVIQTKRCGDDLGSW
eukprot:UN06022